MAEVSVVFTLYRNAPIAFADVELLLTMTISTFSSFVVEDTFLSVETVENVLTIIDNLMNEDLRNRFITLDQENMAG